MDKALLISQFDESMFDIYRRALGEAGYKASRFLAMLNEKGGLATAKYLIHSSQVSEGYTALWERSRLDLTVEAMILGDSRWTGLFDDDELEICQRRLADYGFLPKR